MFVNFRGKPILSWALNSSDFERELEGFIEAKLSLGDSGLVDLCVFQNNVFSAFIAHDVAASNICLDSWSIRSKHDHIIGRHIAGHLQDASVL